MKSFMKMYKNKWYIYINVFGLTIRLRKATKKDNQNYTNGSN